MTNYDIIIIGAGPGGYQAAHYAAKNGLSVCIIEQAHVGGTCLNYGCIPTKTLCRHAEIVDSLKNADFWGLDDMHYEFNFTKIMKHKECVVEQLRDGIGTLLHQPGITLVEGTAHFADNHTIVVNSNKYTASNIIIATGSSAKIPPVEGMTLPGVMTSTELLSINTIPQRLCIIGAGVIGMEFASIFSSFGSNVTVIEYLKECLPQLDADIAKRLRQVVGKKGVEFCMQSSVMAVAETTDHESKRLLTVNFEKKGIQQSVDADVVLVATGRQPNIKSLQLDNTNIHYTEKGITTDANFQTNIEGVWAIGDVNAQYMLAHAATFQGQHVVNCILNKNSNIRFDIMPAAIFTNPEAASVGMSENALKESGRAYECKKAFYRANGKAVAMNETEGMLKIFSDSTTGAIIGCHAFGAHSADMVQEVAALMNVDVTMGQLADMVHIHPTLSEILHSTTM